MYSTLAWIEEVIVRRLRLSPALLCVSVRVITMFAVVRNGGTECGDSMCHRDFDEMVFIDPS